MAGATAKLNGVTAITHLVDKSRANQDACAAEGGVPLVVNLLTAASNSIKEPAAQSLCSAAALAIWRLAEENGPIQTAMREAGVIAPLVQIVGSAVAEMQSNAAGAIAALARDHPENQKQLVRAGAVVPLCALARDGSEDTKVQAAAAMWALAQDNAPNKTTVAKLGGIEPLVGSTCRTAPRTGVFVFAPPLTGRPSTPATWQCCRRSARKKAR